MTDFEREVGQRLAQVRRGRRLSQAQLGAPLGWSRQIVSLVETGQRRLTVPELVAVSIILRVPLVNLLGGVLDSGTRARAGGTWALELVPGFTATPDQVALALQDSEWTEEEERLVELVKQVLAQAGEEEPSSVRTRLAAARLLAKGGDIEHSPDVEVIEAPEKESVVGLMEALKRSVEQGQAAKDAAREKEGRKS